MPFLRGCRWMNQPAYASVSFCQVLLAPHVSFYCTISLVRLEWTVRWGRRYPLGLSKYLDWGPSGPQLLRQQLRATSGQRFPSSFFRRELGGPVVAWSTAECVGTIKAHYMCPSWSWLPFWSQNTLNFVGSFDVALSLYTSCANSCVGVFEMKHNALIGESLSMCSIGSHTRW